MSHAIDLADAFTAVLSTVFDINKEPPGFPAAHALRGAVLTGIRLGVFAEGLNVNEILGIVASVGERLGPDGKISDAIEECREVLAR